MPLMAPRCAGGGRLRWRARILAAVALPVAIAVHRFPLRFLVGVIEATRLLPPASYAHAALLHEAVLAARPAWWPGRIACMEISLATVIAAVLSGHHVRWVFGARPLPNEAHAWVLTCDGPLGAEEDDAVRPWTPVLITPRHPRE